MFSRAAALLLCAAPASALAATPRTEIAQSAGSPLHPDQPASAASRFDAVVAAPKSHQVLLEDEHIRVLRVEVAPGATEPVHEHRWPSVMYFEQPQPITYITYRLVDGRPVETGRTDAPALARSQTVRGDAEGLHAVLNRGSAPFVAVRVEFKGDATARGPVESDAVRR